MKKQDIYENGNQFDGVVAELVSMYLNNMDAYPVDTVVAVQKGTNDIQLTSTKKVKRQWKGFPIFSFIKENDKQTGMEVDILATHHLACNYFAM